jgi:hypothetical protein
MLLLFKNPFKEKNIMSDVCPICKYSLLYPPVRPGDKINYSCENCGNYSLTGTAEYVHETHLVDSPHKAGILSHHIRKAQRQDQSLFSITSDNLERILEEGYPSPQQQADNLVYWLGNILIAPSEVISISARKHQAIIGAMDKDGVDFVLSHLVNAKILSTPKIASESFRLTFEGWERFEELKKGHYDTRIAFMAMQFGDKELNGMYEKTFKPAATQTGFELLRVIDKPRAGLIDDRIKVDIRTAQFVIADLTHGNKGAYWEAGFAEGLGKPVIYTCKKEAWKEEKPHFDTNHYHTIIWDSGNPQEAGERLKATIRATLPTEAKLTDD